MNLKRILFLFLLFFPAIKIFAYSPETTHAGLAEQSALFYNKNFTKQISADEKELIINGATAEDSPVLRVLNHFYDPIRNIGINNYRNAKDWATLDNTGNVFTWNSAIEEYSKGNKKEAFIYLGHILHLVEDMTVPDHTRNDPHMGDGVTGESSYENWAENNKNRDTLSGLSQQYSNLKPLSFNNISEYFDFLANYSNRNFFGDDSINNDVYQYEYPKILESDGFYGYGVDSTSFDKFPIIRIKILRSGEKEFLLTDGGDTSVLSGYFDRLSKQAILAGAGVIDLFLRQGEVARAEYLKKQAEESKREIEKAVELNKSLQNLSTLGLAYYGASSIVKENVVSPLSSKIISTKDNFVSGSKVVGSSLNSAGSLASFTAVALAKEAVKNVSSMFASLNDTKKIITTASSKDNIPNISTGINSAIDAVAVSPTIRSTADIVEEPARVASASTADQLAELSRAYSALSNLKSSLPPVVESKPILAGNPYSPGFGGGEATVQQAKEEPKNEETTENVDKDVDKPVDNQQTEKEKLTIEPQNTGSTTDESTVDNEATSTENDLFNDIPAPILDTTPPDISLTVNSCADSLSEDGCLLGTTTVQVSWGSTADDLSYFEINKDGEISTTTEKNISFDVLDKTSHNFSVSAVDINGNKSDASTKSFEIFKKPIVINEVAWGGTPGHSEDEWLELHNLSDKSIILDNWVLSSKTDKSFNIILSGKISSKGFYLIERKNDGEVNESTQSPVSDIKADLWTSFGPSGIVDRGEELTLSRASTTIDEVPYSNNWNGGVSIRSSERCFDCGSQNWITNNSEINNGLNVAGSRIYGTPRARNYRDYLIPINGVNSGDFTLYASKSPYLVPKSSTLNIKKEINFNIEPGVVIKFGDGASIRSDGKVIAKGTTERPIVFTALSDDEYGGDINGDGICAGDNTPSTASCPSAGKWYGVIISPKGTDSVFSNSIFRYGGLNFGTQKGMLYAESILINISDSIFEYSGSDGATLKGVSGQVFGNTFRNNKGISTGAGLSVSEGEPNIKNNNFIGNSVGLYLYGTNADITDNIFDSNISKGIYVVGKPGNIMTGNRSVGSSLNTGDLINLTGNISMSGSTTTLSANPMPYFISGTLNVPNKTSLYISEGAKIMGTSVGTASRLLVDGEMYIVGSDESPVVFSSNLETPSRNSWWGIVANRDSRVDIKNAIIKDATTAVAYYKSPIILENVSFSNNQLGVSIGQMPSPIEKAVNISFSDNDATTSPKGLW